MNEQFLIETESLVLRHFIAEDALKILVMSQELGLRTWMPDQVYRDEQEATDILCNLIKQYNNPSAPVRAPYVLGMCLKKSGELIGHVGLSPARKQVEIGFSVENKYQGNGFASEAVTALSKWGIRAFNLPLIFGIVASDNIVSCKVLENAGFVLLDESMNSLHEIVRLVRTYQKT